MEKPRRKVEPDQPGSTSGVETGADYEMIQSKSTNGTNSEKTTAKNVTSANTPFAGREVNMRFFIGDQHTSPNKKGIVQINKGPKKISGVDDFGGIFDMAKYHTAEVDEWLTTQKKGILEPPENSTHEELIKFRFKDRRIREDKDKIRNAVSCENPDGLNGEQGQGQGFNQGQGQGFNQSQGQGFNQSQGQGFNQGQGQGFNQGVGRSYNQGQGQGFNQSQGFRAPVTGFGKSGSSSGVLNSMSKGMQSLFGSKSEKSNGTGPNGTGPNGTGPNQSSTGADISTSEISRKIIGAVKNQLRLKEQLDQDSKNKAQVIRAEQIKIAENIKKIVRRQITNSA